MLLTGTGLMVSTMLRLHSVDPGFDARNLLTVSLALPEGGKYVERAGGDMEKATPAVTNFYQRLLERVSALPGVESVGSITGLPTHFSERYTFTILDHPATPPDQRPRAGYDEVSPGFFRTLRIPLRRGRFLTDHDTNSSPWAVVVNEEFVRRFLPNEDPIGKQIRLRYDPYPTEEDRPRQIVGVIGDVKHFGLNRPAPPFIYASYLQQPSAYPGGTIVGQLWQDLAIRMAPAAQAADLSKEVRQIVAELDPEQPIGSIMSMNELLAHSLGQPRFYMQILAVFACIGVFLAGIGIYGVVSYFVSQHTHEIGIRLALGAKMVDIVLWVGKFGFTVVLIGILAGTALGLGLTRLLSALLFGVKPNDPITYFAVAVLLILTACIACYIPARRATKVDPLVALRYE
ncbi:MAG: hypothetical protein AUG75_08850 [Cyanobacteria bacterium 13_1_20CM_4_61_6]|nr:MAG: hypothetical protein AUG75_08850 [Cyanobacteria bacterium 13_1_20CM_4_61_6]